MNDLVRDLAVARAAPAALEDGRARHAGHYAEVLARANELYLSGAAGVLPGLALFDAERANIEAGQRWAVGNAGSREDAAALVLRYSDAGAHVLNLRLTPRQWIAWLDAALAACRRLGDRGGEGAALGNLGLAWADLGEAKKATGFYEQQLVIAREIGDRGGEGNALGNLGNAWADLGEAKKATGFYEQQLVIAREIGDRGGEGNALYNSALEHEKVSERDRAIADAKAALVIYRAIASPHGCYRGGLAG
jgi:tetratricopeptide (TPR) repeat protein